jgi:hypothetical protein
MKPIHKKGASWHRRSSFPAKKQELRQVTRSFSIIHLAPNRIAAESRLRRRRWRLLTSKRSPGRLTVSVRVTKLTARRTYLQWISLGLGITNGGLESKPHLFSQWHSTRSQDKLPHPHPCQIAKLDPQMQLSLFGVFAAPAVRRKQFKSCCLLFWRD